MLWYLLATFVFRLSFGLALAMAWTSSQYVTTGFYRVHLWVLMGLGTFVSLVVGTQGIGSVWLLPLGIIAAITSYLGAVVWMYDAKKLGLLALYVVAGLNLAAAVVLLSPRATVSEELGSVADVLTSGLLLGFTMTAMLLGHWYLNTPSMQLRPLKQLIIAILSAVILRSLLCGGGLVAEVGATGVGSIGWMGLVALRWMSGLVGIAVLAILTWQTLKIPNTQSATGILYVAVIFSFMGELSSQLLAADATYPL